MSLEPGQIIEQKYRIVRLLGEGGMGAVYEGENTRIHRTVAIKVLHAGVASKEDVVQRFEREAQAAGRIGSEHIVEVLDLGSLAGGERFMVMEFLEGEDLGTRIKTSGRLSPQETAPIMLQLLQGLAAAHEASIIHRDLKPDNVFLLKSRGGHKDFVKILDFGVSKFSALDQEMSMTRTGAVMGTPYYMSPEQARGQKVDHRSDLYSVGVVMYQAVTGRVPFNAETFNELVFKIALESPEPAETVVPDLDRSFAAIINKSMQRDANHRFQSAAEFQMAITQWVAQNMPSASSGQYAAMLGSVGGSTGMVPQPGAELGQSGDRLGQSGGPLGQSGAPFGQSGGPLGQSGAMGQSGGLGSSGPFGASQVGLAVTTPTPKRSNAVVVFGLVAAVIGVGGGFIAYRQFGAAPPAAEERPATATEAKTSETAETTSPPDEPATEASSDATAEASAEPSTAPPDATASADDTASAATAVAAAPPPAYRPPPTKRPPPPTKTAAPPPPPPPKNGGRSVGSEL